MMNSKLFRRLVPLCFLIALTTLSYAETNVKNLVLTDCSKASEEFGKLPEEGKVQLFDFFKRVLELKLVQAPGEPGGRESYLLSMQPPNNSPFSSKPMGEDYFRSISPTRDVDAKICVLKLAISRKIDSLQLMPGLFDLEGNSLLSDESKFFVRRSLLEIAHANVNGNREVKQTLDLIVAKLSDKNGWLLSALLVEFGPRAAPTLIRLALSEEEIKFKVALRAIEISRDNQDYIADVLENQAASLTPKRVEQMLNIASKKNLTSLKLFRVILAKLTQATETNKLTLLKLLKTSGESLLALLEKDPQLEAYLSSILLNLKLAEVSGLTEMTCVAGRCDKMLRSIVKNPLTISGIEGKLLSLIALSENFDADLWKFSEDSWKNVNSPNKVLAVRAVAAFPGKKEQALAYLNQAIKELTKGKKILSDSRTELIRSVAHAMVNLSPIPAATIPQSIGEEILSLTSDISHLAAQAISSIKPSPISLLIKTILSKSEASVDEALRAIEKSHPLDLNLFRALLELAGEATPIGATLGDSLQGNISADSVLMSYEDAGLTLLEQLAKGPNEAIARKASIRLLGRRSSNKIGKDLLLKNFSKLSCGAKFEVVSLLKDPKLFKAEQFKHCISELGGSSYLKQQLVSLRAGISSEDWKTLSSQLPQIFLLSECAKGSLLISEELLAKSANNLREEVSSTDAQLLNAQLLTAQCTSRFPNLILPEVKDRFIALLDEKLSSSSTIDLISLAAAIRFQSRSVTIEKNYKMALQDESLSIALGKMLVGSPNVEDLLLGIDDSLMARADGFICNSELVSSKLETRILEILPVTKEENLLPLIQSLSCLNPNSPVLKEQLTKLALTPYFEEGRAVKLSGNLKKIADTGWTLNYLEQRFKEPFGN